MAMDHGSSDGTSLEGDKTNQLFVSEGRSRIDANLLLVLALIHQQDWNELTFRTGIKRPEVDPEGKDPQYLSVLVELASDGGKLGSGGLRGLAEQLSVLELDVPPAYFDESLENGSLTLVTARIRLDRGDPRLVLGKHNNKVPLVEQLVRILASGVVDSLDLAVAHQPNLVESIKYLGLPVDRTYKGKVLTGRGVVIGIIDDGCAFAHPHFLTVDANGNPTTRVVKLWDQAPTVPSLQDINVGWVLPPGFLYGREIAREQISPVLIANTDPPRGIIEDAVYAHFDYRVGDPDILATHGTHVMDIAAGSGTSLTGACGVAPSADIVFVQLPPIDIARPGPALSKAIVDGITYILAEAKRLNRPAVINLSYGGNSGPHDETWTWNAIIDQLLAPDERMVAVAAGNSFERDTHAGDKLVKGTPAKLGWQIRAEDPTSNTVEIWYSAVGSVALTLKDPSGTVYGPYGTAVAVSLRRPSDQKVVGYLSHLQFGVDKQAFIVLRATHPNAETAISAPALAGRWSIELANGKAQPIRFDAWIHRDDAVLPWARRTQSRFAPENAHPRHSIADYATGRKTIAVGAFRLMSDVICAYYACGPTRERPSSTSRIKPDIYAPAEEDAAGRGVLCASSRRSTPTRMNGTSAAAPHVAGLIALMFEYARQHAGGRRLTADEILMAMTAGADVGLLREDRHGIADAKVRVKQGAVMSDLQGYGRVNFTKAMDVLF